MGILIGLRPTALRLLYPARADSCAERAYYLLLFGGAGRLRAAAYCSCGRQYEFGYGQRLSYKSGFSNSALYRLSEKPECD